MAGNEFISNANTAHGTYGGGAWIQTNGIATPTNNG